jgi:hypothetical protein
LAKTPIVIVTVIDNGIVTDIRENCNREFWNPAKQALNEAGIEESTPIAVGYAVLAQVRLLGCVWG